MLLLNNVSSFAPRNWEVLGPTVALVLGAGLGLYLWLRHKERPHHGSVKFYLVVAAILTIITVVEIAILPFSDPTSPVHIGLSHSAWLVILYVLALIKFVMVLMFFMHLYFDRWLYTMFFGIGMGLILTTLWALLALMPGKPVRTPEKYEPKGHGAEQHGRVVPEGILAGVPLEDLQGLGAAERGALVFEAAQCGHCHHVERLPSARGTFGPSLDGVATRAGERVAGMPADAYLRQSIEDPGAHVPRGFFNGMPRLRDRMTDGEFEDLVRFLLTLGSRDLALERVA